MREVTPEEVKKAAQKMSNSKSLGHDNIQADLLKKSIPFTLKAISHIVNLPIRSSKFARQWKIAKVTPLWKGGGEKSEARHYRPVSLLSSLSRLVEKIVAMQVIAFLERNN